jgi:pimeloyl-ACP methyl ester carboxylesterase
MKPDDEGVHPIANTEKPDRAADVVFVHGLSGKSHSTWRYGKVGAPDHFFWPEELGRDLPDCGIWSFGYAAGFTELGNPGMVMDKRAGNLAQQLIAYGIGRKPLIFVTHSMGGLIVKALVSYRSADDDRTTLVDHVRGIVFCGTPHLGSAFAAAAERMSFFFGGWFYTRIRIQSHLREMRSKADGLDSLHDQFKAWYKSHPIGILSFAESRKLRQTGFFLRFIPFGRVVEASSADAGVGGVRKDVDADHLQLVKPPKDGPLYNLVYLRVRDFIRETLCAPTRAHGLEPDKTEIRALIAEILRDQGEYLERTEAVMPSHPPPKVAVSYSWKEEREGTNANAVDGFCAKLKAQVQGVEILRDIERLKHGDSISGFMREIGSSGFLCVFLSEAYLRSPNCMYELLIAWQRSRDNPEEFRSRVKVWVMESAEPIRDLEPRLSYSAFWRAERDRVGGLLTQHGLDGLASGEIVRLNRIRGFAEHVNEMLEFFADTLSPVSEEEFEAWIAAEFPGSGGSSSEAVDEERLAQVYANVENEMEGVISSNDSLRQFLETAAPGLFGGENGGALNDEMRARGFDITNYLEGIEDHLREFRATRDDLSDLEKLVGGLVVLAVDRE